jgi:hypothetical protein
MNIIPEMRLEYYIGYLCLYYYHMIYTTDGGLLVLTRGLIVIVHHQWYRSIDRNTDYGKDDTLED